MMVQWWKIVSGDMYICSVQRWGGDTCHRCHKVQVYKVLAKDQSACLSVMEEVNILLDEQKLRMNQSPHVESHRNQRDHTQIVV